MNEYKVFDINRPLLSNESEQIVKAKSAKEAIAKIVKIEANQYVRQMKEGFGGRFVVSKTTGKNRTVYDIFNK